MQPEVSWDWKRLVRAADCLFEQPRLSILRNVSDFGREFVSDFHFTEDVNLRGCRTTGLPFVTSSRLRLFRLCHLGNLRIQSLL